MFNCEFCNKTTKPGEPQTKVVTQTRLVERMNKQGEWVFCSEIKEEKNACPSCAEERKK